VKFKVLVETYERIESTTKRLEMTSYLVDLLKKTPDNIIDKVVYLLQGKIYPAFVGIELGMAEKLAIRAISIASGFREDEIEKEIRKEGDIGKAAEELMKKKKQTSFFKEELTVERVYDRFERIARAQGKDSQDLKIRYLLELLQDGEPLEARYAIRTVVGKLRLGTADMTIIDALSIAFGSKEDREIVERAYNVHSDLGQIAKTLREKGIEGLRGAIIEVGVPIKAMLAERARSVDEILERMKPAMIEYKYDGLRLQAHIGNEIKLFSRRLEDLTSQFPDVCKSLKEIFGKEKERIIVEGECVAVNSDTGEMLPFQVISHRRGRKYGLKEAMEAYPVVLFVFDCLYADTEDLTLEPLRKRREILERIFRKKENQGIRLSTAIVSGDKREIENFFMKAIEDGCEGIIAKSLESEYRAGARGWNWIKYKRDYISEMVDTVDLVVVGAFAGQGRRAGTYGALLVATYSKEADCFETVSKLGTGFDDKTLAELPKMFKGVDKKPARVKSEVEADYWFEPETVIEVLGAEVTLSPIHTCAKDYIRKDSGFAIRFPRFTGNWRYDKSPEEATTNEEILEMYKKQLKRIEEKT
jgi:DNA ligase-1